MTERPTPYYADDLVTLYHGDCLDVLRSLPDASVEAVCTDPPYGLANTDPAHVVETLTRWVNGERDYLPGGSGFMGKAWDAFVPPVAVWDDCLRVLKPGGHVLAFAGSRTVDLMTLGLRLAGFEIRDSIAWLYGSGFPKSLDVSKAIDKAAGAEREVVGPGRWNGVKGTKGRLGGITPEGFVSHGGTQHDETAPATPDAERWQGWGSAMKPAFEPVVVARKPLIGTIAQNVLTHGTGALNIDGCRVGDGDDRSNGGPTGKRVDADEGYMGRWSDATEGRERPTGGRWPANVILDESQAEVLDEQSGELSHNPPATWRRSKDDAEARRNPSSWQLRAKDSGETRAGFDDKGGASRFFFIAREDNDPCTETPNEDSSNAATSAAEAPKSTTPRTPEGGESSTSTPSTLPIDQLDARFTYVAKADTSERVRVNGTAHPTVKPLALMRWLVRLVTPPGGTVLEPFAGSGTTVEACLLEGFKCIAIEREADYLPLIQQRIDRRLNPVAAIRSQGEEGGLFDLLNEETA